MKTIKIGIIGWGFMGRTHAHALRAMPLFYPGAGFRAEIAGICSRRLEKAREAAEELNVPYYTDDYRQLLAREEIDAVSVCTPNALHEEIALAALKAGKHLYIDKPLADTAQGARRIADQAEKSGVFTRMVFNNRYLPVTLRARELVDQGRIGRVLSFEGTLSPFRLHRPEQAHRLEADPSGGRAAGSGQPCAGPDYLAVRLSGGGFLRPAYPLRHPAHPGGGRYPGSQRRPDADAAAAARRRHGPGGGQ